MQVMSRYGDCKVYVGDLGNNASKPELEDAFSYYGPLRNVWVARNPPGFAFVEFEDPRDAEDAVRGLDGRTICGRRARVEMSNGGRGYGRGPPPRSRLPARPYDDRCYDCGDRGHYARDCTRRRRRRLSLACAPRTNSSVSALLIVCAT
ncbi:RNA recognition motif domain-containing protein [Phthorimaea operculella]|nr:RNA recognition motif domain-containing protein [Phthorimaea operculella]